VPYFTNTTTSKEVNHKSIFVNYFISQKKGPRPVKLASKVLILKDKKLALEYVTLHACLGPPHPPIFKTWSQTQVPTKRNQVSSHISRERRSLR